MLSPNETEVDNIYEVRFKNTRKAFYRNINGLKLFIGDAVVVESDRGYDVGTLSLGGIMARLQMKKKGMNGQQPPRIYRKANEADVELLQKVRDKEIETRKRGREIIQELKLDMKLSDVEYQGDNTKAIFYYIADHRVDFRELIKVLAREFRVRVEMKQIGLRHEAGLVGGIGSCGRELCCSTWLTSFRTVSTSAARYQNLSLNPMKISGLCGRLKCCLNFELETYLDALKDFPKISRLETEKGVAILQKTDIFKQKMWFSYEGETTWYPLTTAQVKRIQEENAKGNKAVSLGEEKGMNMSGMEVSTPLDFVDVVGQISPKMLEEKSRKNRKSKNRRGKAKAGTQNNNNSKRRGTNKQTPQKNNETQKKTAVVNNKSKANQKNTDRKSNSRTRIKQQEKSTKVVNAPNKKGVNQEPKKQQENNVSVKTPRKNPRRRKPKTQKQENPQNQQKQNANPNSQKQQQKPQKQKQQQNSQKPPRNKQSNQKRKPQNKQQKPVNPPQNKRKHPPKNKQQGNEQKTQKQSPPQNRQQVNGKQNPKGPNPKRNQHRRRKKTPANPPQPKKINPTK